MHVGKDTQFYLKKGFRVVAVEANPELVAQAREKFSDAIRRGRLRIMPVAIDSFEGETTFYRNLRENDWSTVSRVFAERNDEEYDSPSEAITVKCRRFESILEEVGVPFYLKIDIEGADILCLEALHRFERRPEYLSVEAGLLDFEETFTELSHLWLLGYRDYKIVNQALNHTYGAPNPPLHGQFVDARFGGYSSGPFGEEAHGRWMGIEETFTRYRGILKEQSLFGYSGRYHGTRLNKLYNLYLRARRREPVGWYDFHARLGGTAQASDDS